MRRMGETRPSPPPPSSLCCMCGDLGIPEELFRCKACLFRSQHKYCSDLYPRAAAYAACNWCLRDERRESLTDVAAMGLGPPVKRQRAAVERRVRQGFRGKVRRYKLLEEVSGLASASN
ncbi:hypothetical protein HPP92_016372 [Vanilla planifolia]|uniref:PHD-type zinc finger plants domain-containing protein n=1 Tax=Vanilla planifolia TaxID=51239 RepID=A0A835UPX5_VANPL|nr:hypothetical protein HPP92_016372 [Vanilla planifolia]